MRYVEVTHKYAVAIPDEEIDEGFDMVANSAVSMMEEHMKRLNPGIGDMQSSWQIMPREYRPTVGGTGRPEQPAHRSQSEVVLKELGYEKVGEVSITDLVQEPIELPDIHPWKQGLRIFPVGDPNYDMETVALSQAGWNCPYSYGTYHCTKVKNHQGEHLLGTTLPGELPAIDVEQLMLGE